MELYGYPLETYLRMGKFPQTIYLELENPRDLDKLEDPLEFLEAIMHVLICIDEVKKILGIFQVFKAISITLLNRSIAYIGLGFMRLD